MMLSAFQKVCIASAAIFAASTASAYATSPKLDDSTCNQLRLEHHKFVENGTAADLQRGPEWGKANLSPEKLRELELYIQLDEQVKFGCRDAKLTLDAERAGEAAKRLELNPDLDPTAPLPAPVKKPVPAGKDATGTDKAASSGSDGGEASVKPSKPPKRKPSLESKPNPEPKPERQPKADAGAKATPDPPSP